MKPPGKNSTLFTAGKRMSCIAIILFFIVTALPISVPSLAAGTSGYWTDYAVEPTYNSNSQTYYIGSAAELAWVANKINNHTSRDDFLSFELTADFDLFAHYWVPIGAMEDFGGIYDFNGMGHSITGLTIEGAECPGMVYEAAGLFGSVHEGCSIWDVNVLNVSISTNAPESSLVKMGALAGIVRGGQISGCSSTGSVSGSVFDYAAGGLIGLLYHGTIKDSCSDCTVSSTTPLDHALVSCGGLIGVADNAAVLNCYAQGNVSSTGLSGGLIGMAIGGSVINCYSTADAYSQIASGGLIGHAEKLNISSCYAAGSVSRSADAFAGSFIGEIYSITIEHGFCLKQAAGGIIIGDNPQMLVLDVTAVSTEYMKSPEFVSTLNEFASKDSKLHKWLSDTENTNESYPVLDGVWIPAIAPASKTAVPTSASVSINGKPVAFQAYNIDDYNYFKLRDLAKALNGSSKQFEVGWDAANNAIGLTSKTPYTAVGGELTASETGIAVDATKSTSKVYLDGAVVSLTAYTINGSNYFKLRDIAAALNFGVVWNESKQMIEIDTASGYVK